MLHKARNGYGRSRTTPRDGRRVPTVVDQVAARVAAARRVAAAFIAARWPELARVSPTLTARQAHAPSPELLARLGLDCTELAQHADAVRYTFTFAGVRGTPDGADAPLVAAVTVDEQHQIVKASVTR